MTGVKNRLLGLCLPPLAFCTLDATLTLLGQSADYWAGNHVRANEASPTFSQLLQSHPAAFVVGNLMWAAMFVGLILLLPDALALIVSIVVTVGHTFGAATWLVVRFHCRYQSCMGLFLLSAILLGAGIYWGWRARPEQEFRLSGWRSILRWASSVLLIGIAVYLFLWPH